jgi:hypothetical protein
MEDIMPKLASQTTPSQDLTAPDPACASLAGTWSLCWDLLEEGAARARVPFHTPVLATISDHGPEARTVVLRDADREALALTCHTDARSAKFGEIRGDGRVSWLFYDPGRKLQVRIRAIASAVADGAVAERRWTGVRVGSRRCYLSTEAPGAPLPQAGNALPASLRARRPTADESETGRVNFAVVESRVVSVDCLYLDSEGHRRAQFDCASGVPEGRWVAP